MLAVDVWSGSFRYTVIPDRGMDVCRANYQGIPIDWVSGTGVTSPFSYDPAGWRWLRSFHGGLVHTCGLGNVGEPSEDDAMSYGGHGDISNTPAREVAWGVEDRSGVPTAFVSGKVRSVSPTEWNLLLTRRISCKIGGTSLVIEDTLENLGFNDAPVFLLYHCNIGFPFLSGDSTLEVPATTAVDEAGNPVESFTALSDPTESTNESVIHPLIENDASEVEVVLRNPRLGNGGLDLFLRYSSDTLRHLTIWKHFQKRGPVLAIEPGTCRVGGRHVEMANRREVVLERDDVLSTQLEIGIRQAG